MASLPPLPPIRSPTSSTRQPIIKSYRAIPEATINQLKEAISNDNTTAFNDILDTYHESGQPFHVNEIRSLVWDAIPKDNVTIIEKILSYDYRISECFIESATRNNAKSVMSFFLEQGWNLNSRTFMNRLPAFWKINLSR